jgi:hypothetical protein
MERNFCVPDPAASAVVTGSQAIAGELYTRVDVNGCVTFVDRPNDQRGKECLPINYARTSNSVIHEQKYSRQHCMEAHTKVCQERLTQ